jgi:type II secretory pathway pseudopilin PulG
VPTHHTTSKRRPDRAKPTRAAMTLVEMLVAMALTLIMMAAVAQLFATFGTGVGDSRRLLEMDERMRAVALRLRQDLDGVTARVTQTPPRRPADGSGYFEIIEGPRNDFGNADVVGSPNRLLGDIDDVLLFTTRSPGEPFRGMTGNGPIESPNAEVIWYCRLSAAVTDPNTDPDPQLYTLYRRQRLVMSHPGAAPFVATPNAAPFTTWAALHDATDISCRVQAGFAIPNSLGDLTKREYRFCHERVFPHRFNPGLVDEAGRSFLRFEPSSPRYGEDVILTNVIGFDVRVFDPDVFVRVAGDFSNSANSAVTLVPGDPGYPAGVPTFLRGAYVDLGWGNRLAPTVPINQAFPPSGQTVFERTGMAIRESAPSANEMVDPTYDTWSNHYDAIGIDTTGDGIPDTTTYTSAPYPVGLRGVEIRIRCYEPASRKVRQVTVRHTFAPN